VAAAGAWGAGAGAQFANPITTVAIMTEITIALNGVIPFSPKSLLFIDTPPVFIIEFG
jgi:hypothetical protein